MLVARLCSVFSYRFSMLVARLCSVFSHPFSILVARLCSVFYHHFSMSIALSSMHVTFVVMAATGVCLNDAYASSDTDSRESSAGSVRSADYPHPPQLSPGTVLHPPAARGSVERSGVDGDRLKSSIVNVPPAGMLFVMRFSNDLGLSVAV